MVRSHPVLACVTALYIAAIVVFTFAMPSDATGAPSPWWSFGTFLFVGLLLALLSRAWRWWVALGFSWLGAAWVEAAQAVWLPGRARVEDVVLGCLGGLIGVSLVVAYRAFLAGRLRASIRPRERASTRPGVTATAGGPPSR